MQKSIKTSYSPLIGVLFCLSLGVASGYSVKAGDSLWYATLNKPSFTPPNWIFGPVWSILYVMMGVVLGKLVENIQKNKLLLILFALQFSLNLLWSPLYFFFHRIDLALYDIILLLVTLIAFLFVARDRKVIFWLFIPYLLWVSFALILNYSILVLN